MRLRTQKYRNSVGNSTLHKSYKNRRHGATTNAVYGRLSVFLSNQHIILERYFASARRLPKPRTPKDSKGPKGPRTPPHHSTSHRAPGSGHQAPSNTSTNHLQVLPRGPGNLHRGSRRGHDVGKCYCYLLLLPANDDDGDDGNASRKRNATPTV